MIEGLTAIIARVELRAHAVVEPAHEVAAAVVIRVAIAIAGLDVGAAVVRSVALDGSARRDC